MRHNLIFYLLFLLLVGCSTNPTPVAPTDGGEMQTGATFSFAQENAALAVTITAHEAISDATLTAELPDGEQAQSVGDMAEGDIKTVRFAVDEALTRAVSVRLTNGIVDYGATWSPQDGRITTLKTVEVGQSVDVTLRVTPARPAAGDVMQIDVQLVAQVDVVGAIGRLQLPPNLTTDDPLTWQGDLAAGSPQQLTFSAVATDALLNPVTFELSVFENETIVATHLFVEPTPIVVQQMPTGVPYVDDVAQPTTVQLDAPVPAEFAGVHNVPNPHSADFTFIELEAGQYELYVMANQPLSNVTIEIDGAIASGDSRWQGTLVQFATVLLRWRIDAAALSRGENQLTARLQADGGISAEQTFTIETANNDDSRETAAIRNYSGRFFYREENDPGMVRGVYYSRVEVFDYDSADADDLICNTVTDANGYWDCSGEASDPFDDTIEVYARASAVNGQYGSTENSSGTRYDIHTSTRDISENGTSDYSFGSYRPGNDEDGAYHIQKMITYAGVMIDNKGGSDSTPDSGDANFLTVVWPDTDNDQTSYYNGWKIRMEGPTSCNSATCEPDEWDESVILHEYGHFAHDAFSDLGPPSVEYCNSPGETPPCSHSFNSHEDLPSAWIEGWANGFQSAVKLYWGMDRPEDYVETNWSVDIENSWHSVGGTAWDDSEGTIAGILLDIFDTPADDQNNDGVGDIIDMLYDDIHDTFSFYNPPGSERAHPWDIHDFYTGFQARNSQDNAIKRIYYEHGIDKTIGGPGSYSLVSPSHFATNQSVNGFLDWSNASDPDGDPVTYDVYLERNDSSPDILVCSGSTLSACYYSNLEYSTIYYWRVVAEDIYGNERASVTWRFTTEAVPTAVGMGEISAESPLSPLWLLFALPLLTATLVGLHQRKRLRR